MRGATQLGPVPLPAPIEDRPEEQRHLFCSSYDACLSRAAREDWASWTCTHCVRFQRLRRARIEETAERALGAERDETIQVARAEVLGRGVGSPGAAASAPPAATSRGGKLGTKVSHALEEQSGVVHMRLEAPSVPALFIEAARAVAEAIRGRPVQPPVERAEEVSLEAAGFGWLLVAWIRELVQRSVRSHVRFEEFEIIYVSERKLVAWIRGVRVEQMRTRLGTATYHDPLLVQRPGHLTAMPVLRVNGHGDVRDAAAS